MTQFQSDESIHTETLEGAADRALTQFFETLDLIHKNVMQAQDSLEIMEKFADITHDTPGLAKGIARIGGRIDAIHWIADAMINQAQELGHMAASETEEAPK